MALASSFALSREIWTQVQINTLYRICQRVKIYRKWRGLSFNVEPRIQYWMNFVAQNNKLSRTIFQRTNVFQLTKWNERNDKMNDNINDSIVLCRHDSSFTSFSRFYPFKMNGKIWQNKKCQILASRYMKCTFIYNIYIL